MTHIIELNSITFPNEPSVMWKYTFRLPIGWILNDFRSRDRIGFEFLWAFSKWINEPASNKSNIACIVAKNGIHFNIYDEVKSSRGDYTVPFGTIENRNCFVVFQIWDSHKKKRDIRETIKKSRDYLCTVFFYCIWKLIQHVAIIYILVYLFSTSVTDALWKEKMVKQNMAYLIYVCVCVS